MNDIKTEPVYLWRQKHNDNPWIDGSKDLHSWMSKDKKYDTRILYEQPLQEPVKQESWISILDCELQNNDLIYAHRFDDVVIEAVYRFWKDHKNPHRIISNEFGHESINEYKHVMHRKLVSIPRPPVSHSDEQPVKEVTK